MLHKKEKLARRNMHNIITYKKNYNIITNQIRNKKLKGKHYK
jgi:hypothetical protein